MRLVRWKGANSLRRLETSTIVYCFLSSLQICWKGANSLRRLETLGCRFWEAPSSWRWKGANSLRRLETFFPFLKGGTGIYACVGKGLIRFGGLKRDHTVAPCTSTATSWKGANSLRRLETLPILHRAVISDGRWKGANSLRRLETCADPLSTCRDTSVGKGLSRFGGLKRNDIGGADVCRERLERG